VKTVKGGSSRAQTVLNGLLYIRQQDSECEWVLVHDAARPCLPGEDLDALLKHAPGCQDGAILANPVTDTLKREGATRYIENTVDRSRLWAAQTPQMFRLDPLLSNMQAAINSGAQPTDEAEAMERAGCHPLLVPGSAHNIKITGSQDLVMAEFILLQRGR
jgi:2-C-methyl-D-erythritol 4-phosphate cytidylyltransferase